MEAIVMITKVGELTDRSFTNKEGQTVTVKERELWMRSGASHFKGTLAGTAAVGLRNDSNALLQTLSAVSFDIVSREYTRDGNEKTFTDIKINAVYPF